MSSFKNLESKTFCCILLTAICFAIVFFRRTHDTTTNNNTCVHNRVTAKSEKRLMKGKISPHYLLTLTQGTHARTKRQSNDGGAAVVQRSYYMAAATLNGNTAAADCQVIFTRSTDHSSVRFTCFGRNAIVLYNRNILSVQILDFVKF